eukprot:1604878-Amphidinium_carterae.1
MASTGDKRQKWIDSIKKKLDSFKNNHATEVIGHDLKKKCRQVARHGRGSEEHEDTASACD